MPVVASVNVNGIRAASRRGMPAWLAARRPDVLLLQEVRADPATLLQHLGPGWHVAEAEAAAKGRAGAAPRAVGRAPRPKSSSRSVSSCSQS